MTNRMKGSPLLAKNFDKNKKQKKERMTAEDRLAAQKKSTFSNNHRSRKLSLQYRLYLLLEGRRKG